MNFGSELVLFFQILFGIGMGCVWGAVCNNIVHNKGYNDNWFWWGFWFGLIAVIVACTKPENYDPNEVAYNNQIMSNQRLLAEGGWECTCGRVNARYVSTCVCGKTKRAVTIGKGETPAPQKPTEKENIETLKEYKDLLDAGIISQEEFEAKKKKLLGL